MSTLLSALRRRPDSLRSGIDEADPWGALPADRFGEAFDYDEFARRSIFAPHPLNEGVTPRAARIAEGARPAAPSARPSTIVGRLVVDLVAAITLGVFVAAVLLWACVFAGRL